jgi:hypothetical protein
MVLKMANLKEKINYITNDFTAGKPALEGETSYKFLVGVINELASDESNYAEFKNSIPAIYKAAVDEINAGTNDSKHILVSTMLKNVGITSTLKEDNITQKPVFVDFLIEKAEKEGNDALNKDISDLMNHAFDEKNNRIEISSLISIAHKCITEDSYNKNDVVSRFLASENFTGDEYIKYCGAAIALNNLKDFDYDLTSNQTESLAIISKTLDNLKKESLSDPDSNLNKLLTEASDKYSKSFFSNDLDIEAQLHKVRAEENLNESAGLISSHDLGTPIKDILKERDQQKLDEEKNALLVSWEERYHDYLKKIGTVKIMTSGDKFKKRFAHHGFAPQTSNVFGDSIVHCDKFGDPESTVWNISPLTGTMKLSRDMRYNDPSACQQAFAIAALNARRQGWDTIFLNHPGPDQEAKLFIEHSFNAMVEIGDYSFDAISVPKRYQHVLDQLKRDALTGTLENNANVTDEVRNSKAVKAEPAKNDIDSEQTEPEQASKKTMVQDNVSEEPVKATPENNATFIPDAFDQTDDSIFDMPEHKDKEPLDEIRAAMNEEDSFDNTEVSLHDNFDNSLSDDAMPVEEMPHFAQDFDNIDYGQHNCHEYSNLDEIDMKIPDELLKEQEDSMKNIVDDNSPKKDASRKNSPGKVKFT